MVWSFIQSQYRQFQSVAIINYTELLGEADKGNIKSIAIDKETGATSGDYLAGVNGKTVFRSNVPSDLFESFTGKILNKNPLTKINFTNESGSSISGFIFSWGPFILMVGFLIYLIRRTQGGGAGNPLAKFSKSRAKPAINVKETFQDVAGQQEATEELREIVEFLREPQKFQRLGGRVPKGVLLVGPPGVGKTLLARAVAGEADVPFFSISGSDFVEMFVGVGASRVRDLFQQAQTNRPCIIFIDELDAVGRNRGNGLGGAHEEREQTLDQLLSEMDGFESNAGVIIIAATNRADVLDPALLRPGRFDRLVVLSKPDLKGREEILRIHTRKIPIDGTVDFSKIARGTIGLSGADLANLVNEAALNAARHDQITVTNEDLEFANEKVTMGGERKSLVISEKEKMTTAVHEIGHVIVALFVPPPTDPIHKVTIIPRGMALGLTQQLPEEDRHNYSNEYLANQLAILMGGRCAEELILKGQQTTGASNDIERATELAYRMVCEWGMSRNLGLQRFISKESGSFLGRALSENSHNHSDRTAQKIDDEIRDLLQGAWLKASNVIAEKIEISNKLINALLREETLDSEQIKAIAGL